MVGWHPLRTWSSTRKVVATSSAEAELYSAVEGASRGLGLQSMLREMGVDASLELSTDSSSAKVFASTRGLGRMRHLEVERLVAPGFGERRPSHIEEDPWQSQCVRRAHEVLRQSVLHKVAGPRWNPRCPSRESRLGRGGLLIHRE